MIHKYPKSIDSQPFIKGRNLEASLIPLKTSSSIPSTPMYYPGSKRMGSSTSTQAMRKRISPLASREKLSSSKKFEIDTAPANIWPFNDLNDQSERVPDNKKDLANLEYLISEEVEPSKDQEHIATLTRTGTDKSFKTTKSPKKFFPKLAEEENYEENFFKLPEEFKSQTIFRLLYSRKGDKNYQRLDPVISPNMHNKNQSVKLAPLVNSQEDINYYHLETGGYKNYKYPCIENFLQKPKKKFAKQDKRNTIESTITHLHTVQQVISTKKKQLMETLAQKTLQERTSSKEMTRHKNTYSSGKLRGGEIRVSNDFRPFSTSTGFKSPNNMRAAEEGRPSTHSMYFRKTFVPNFKSIINDKKASFKEKQIKQEYDFYVQMSKKYLDEKKQQLQKSNLTDEEKTVQKFQLETIEKEKAIILKIFIETQEVFKKHPKYVTDRVLLALNLQPNIPFSTVKYEEFKEFKEILCFKESDVEGMVNFVVKFFKIDDQNLSKQDFFRILRTITDRIDSRLMMQPEKANLFENFIENFELTGILRKNTNEVDFERFKYIYSTHKMNIRDMIDLISGVV